MRGRLLTALFLLSCPFVLLARPDQIAGGASVTASAAADRSLVETPGGRRISAVGAPVNVSRRLPETPFVIARFEGRIPEASRRTLASAGFVEIAYLPHDALLLKRPAGPFVSGGLLEEPGVGRRVAAGAVRDDPASAADVAAWIPYLPEDRLSRELTAAELLARDDTSEIPVMIHVMPGESPERVLVRLAERGLPVVATGRAGAWGRITTLVPPIAAVEAALDLASAPEVFFIERIHRIGLLNDRSPGTVQSGVQGAGSGQTPIWNQGIHGEGQIVGEIDTGADADNCWFRDAARGLPPTNTWSSSGGYETAVDTSHRKIIAYDFLYSCDQYPGSPGCENPSNPAHWDTLGHGTHVGGNMCADNDANPVLHDAADGIAPAARFVPQDAGYAVDNCGDLPGIGCPVIDTYPLFDQASVQGVRIHNNSYGDNENAATPNQSNYTARTQDIDRFMWDHREFLIVHAAGNSGAGNADFSVGTPSTNKNGLAIGSTRTSPTSGSDENMSSFSSRGWTGDGRIKPDVMAPGCNVSAGNNRNVSSTNCGTDSGCGTSYASPTAVGAAALVRQYFTDGFYPTGSRNAADGTAPSAALLKAALINSAVPMTGADNTGGAISPIPSNEQGWGRIRLDRSLLFAPPVRRLYADDHRIGLPAGPSSPFTFTFSAVTGAEPLKVTLVWTDYPATLSSPPVAPSINNPASWTTPRLVNDLDLAVSGPSGSFLGNVFSGGVSTAGGSADRRNNVEQVLIQAPAAGTYTVTVAPFNVVQPGQEFALVVTGAWGSVADCSPGVPTGLAVTTSSPTSVSLDWTAGAPAGASYQVWRTSGDCVEGPWTLAGTTASASFTDPGLDPAATYLYRVTALSADGKCASRRSSCVVGKCGAPVFGGLSSASTDGSATCGITLSWPSASSICPEVAIVYNVYRDTDPAFTPGPANRIASCVPGTSYHDTAQLVSGIPVTYIARAEDPRFQGSGPCSGGLEDPNTRRVTATPTGPLQTLFGDGFESGLGAWSASQWSMDTLQKRSGLASAHSDNTSNMCAALTLASGVPLVASAASQLNYSAHWSIEPGWDGALVEASPGPAFDSWTTLSPAPPYPGSRNTSPQACIPPSVPSYTGSNVGWVDASASLAPFAGQAVRVRFRYGTDGGVNNGGFWIDDVSITGPTSCVTTVDEVSPDGSAIPLRITRLGGSLLRATFQRLPGAAAYNLYEGSAFAGSFYSHGGSPGNRCAAAVSDPGDGSLTFDFAPSAGSARYFLVTAAAGGVEGPSGYATAAEIPPAESTCPP